MLGLFIKFIPLHCLFIGSILYIYSSIKLFRFSLSKEEQISWKILYYLFLLFCSGLFLSVFFC